MTMVKRTTIESDAIRALSYNGKQKNVGGYALKHKPSCYGVALKWLIGARRMTYEQFAKKYDGSTGQNINHLINRADKSRFFEENITDMCKILRVSKEYFLQLSGKIDELMED